MLLRLDSHGPRYAQITRALGASIRNGALAPGTRVPSSRELARDLSCSRNLVLLAYEQLCLEGYLTARGGAGTFVSRELPVHASQDAQSRAASRGPLPALSKRGRRTADIAARAMSTYRRLDRVDTDFMYGLCEPDARMIAAFRRALVSALDGAPFGYPPPAGDELLRRQIAVRLRTRRGIACAHSQILITNGTQQALEICVRLLVEEGDPVVVEDSTYDGASTVFAAAGAHIVRVPVDRQGLVVSALPLHGPSPRLVYVTPSHQFPTGEVMSASRRSALLEWAKARGAYIIEDDYDSEFRYGGQPIEALAALEPGAPVIYSGTFAKSLFSSLRLGYLSLPPELVAPAVGCKWLSDRGSPAILQRTVAELMANGEYDRHVRRMLRSYRTRRQTLLTALLTHLGSAAEIGGADAGLHLVVRLRNLERRQLMQLVAICRERGVGIFADIGGPAVDIGPPRTGRSRQRPGLLLGYGLVPVNRIESGVTILAAAYREIVGARRRTAKRQIRSTVVDRVE
jgi:GntR family transcriptional regulator/MocR family aminotransferase